MKYLNSFNEMYTDSLSFGNTYTEKYLNHSYEYTEIEPIEGFIKSYKIINKSDSQLFKAILDIMEDGRAILAVNYTTYNGVKNKYKIYFDKDGREIIDANNSTTKEKRYFDSL